MGMAASQARLLTITARLADNELRSQTINNAKMRLAAQGAYASDEYIAALNNANLVFANNTADGVSQMQALTFNNLTQFSAYNNQYGIVNSAGLLLVSEEDAKIFDANKNSLEGFLKAHGLEWKTTFFNGTEGENGSDLSQKITSFYGIQHIINQGTDNQKTLNDIGYYFQGKSNKELEEMYLQSLSEESSIAVMNYDMVAQKIRAQKANAVKTIQPVVAAEILNGKTIAQIVDDKFKGKTSASALQTAINGSDYSPEKLAKILCKSDESENYNKTKDSLMSFLNGLQDITIQGKNYIAIGEELNTNSTFENGVFTYTEGNIKIKVENGKVTASIIAQDKDGNITEGNSNSNPTPDYTAISISQSPIGTITLSGDLSTKDKIISALSNHSSLLFKITEQNYKTDENGNYITDDKGNYITDGTSDYYIKFKDNKVFSVETSMNSEENKKTVCNDFATEYINYAITSTDLIDFDAYLAGNQEYGSIKEFFENTYDNDIMNAEGFDLSYLTDFEAFAANIDVTKIGKPAFKSVVNYYLVDKMLNVLGEPKFAWIDANDPANTGNADSKAQWYTNLFNRMQKGYKVLENGLAQSAEWMEQAFESGLVTMEQVDLSQNWVSLDYKTCASITEETDTSAAVAKAEAKYQRAMNDIKSKDRLYDLQLKNIDTEHSALQTEYDSVKNAMNKNIDRTMKFCQNG